MSAPEGLDLAPLQRFFDAQVPSTQGPLSASLIAGGKSNLTYRLTDGIHQWVLRRPPLGPLTPTAHDMAREYRVIAALSETDVPVAQPVALCEDPDVLGVPFAVVSYVDGLTMRSADDTQPLPVSHAQRCSHALVDTLASLHAVPHDEIGLNDFGRPSGYLERQVRRWRSQWDRVATRELPDLQQLHDALARALPTQAGESIVHGDFRLDNTLLDHTDPGVVRAVVDWEMATLGDPLADLGLMLVYWDPVTEPVLGVRHAIAANPGFARPDELAQRYATRSGRPVDNLGFYRALASFKLAVIAEGIHQRYLAGKTVGNGFDTVGAAVPALLTFGLEAL
ncbi:phosphotransferase family protein [Saccharopolyspora sp. ASAGF58]|uniref:phosphotransferase family protein n=1 Tax=Saccharopolyspora sp. ASAGF58 TaxID=2719023 RepID=UPI00144013FB|nr:phosphotransferase family protein [Saccharopolyspora sp. ASAGF58]QIZ38004.1 phosphotransferase family protein [Saccharopolyspora sp. ASAGF58]